jgi:hypothetical protein
MNNKIAIQESEMSDRIFVLVCNAIDECQNFEDYEFFKQGDTLKSRVRDLMNLNVGSQDAWRAVVAWDGTEPLVVDDGNLRFRLFIATLS